ncbi:MAG: T9SS type A sorting domain-containing protein [Saprospiraceae bacterium]
MKNTLLFLILMLGSIALAEGQITISNLSFPKAGDSLQTSTDATVASIKIPKNGLNQVWDMRSLNSGTVDVVYVKRASDGKAFSKFPNSDVMEQRGGLEYYINVTNGVYEEIGFSGATPDFFNIGSTTRISPANILRRAPMNFLDLNNTSTATSVPIPLAVLPDSLRGQLGALTSIADSIRIKFSASRTDLVDGYGMLKLPIGEYEVLREKRITYSQSDIEAFVKFTKSWVNIGQFIPAGQLPGGLNGFLGKDTTFAYHFFAENSKEPLAEVTMSNTDNTQAIEVTYKNIRKPVAAKDFFSDNGSTRPDIKAMPNPAIDFVNFELSNLQQGNYTIRVYNLLGTVVWEEQHVVSGSKSVRLDTNYLKKGTYLYSLTDSKGRMLATKKLIVLKA